MQNEFTVEDDAVQGVRQGNKTRKVDSNGRQSHQELTEEKDEPMGISK